MDNNPSILYRVLALAFTYPDDARLWRRIRDALSAIDLETLQSPNCRLPEFILALNALSETPHQHIQAEYTRLFISGYPHLPCPPYESAYREGVLLGNSAEAVDRIYRQWGVAVAGEEVDHVAVELEFMAFLLALDAPEALQAARNFREEHLKAWLPQFIADIEEAAQMPFYRTTARFLNSVLNRALDAD